MTTPLNGSSADRADDQDLVRLLRLTAPRPSVDPTWSALARPVVHRAWRDAARRRRWRVRIWGTAVAALVVLAMAGVWRSHITPGPPAAVVVVVAGSGPVTMIPSSRVKVASVLGIGDAIPAGAAVMTDATSRATLALPSQQGQLRLDVDTRAQVGDDGVITVERGRVYLDSGARRTVRHGFEIRTVHGIVHDVGTRFEVHVTDAALRVRVRDGAVTVTRGATTREAKAGTELTVARGAITARALSPHDAEWKWTALAAPPFVLEGQTLEAFLTWVSAEGGWRVRYAAERRGREVAGSVLHGTIDGLTPEEALEAVLPTCGFTHRIDGDGVMIDAVGEEGGSRR